MHFHSEARFQFAGAVQDGLRNQTPLDKTEAGEYNRGNESRAASNTCMTQRPTWWSGSGVFLVCIILAGVVTNLVIQTPNNTGGGTMMMCITIVLAVIFKATFQFFMGRRQKRMDNKSKQDENQNHVA